MQFTYSRNWKCTTHAVAAQTGHNKNSKIKRETFPFKRCHDPNDTHWRVKLDVKYKDPVCIGMRMRWGVDGNGFSAIPLSSLSNTFFLVFLGGGALLAKMAYGTVWEGLIRGERRTVTWYDRGGGLGICCFLLKRRLVGKIKNSRIWQSEKGERKSDPDNRQKYSSLTESLTLLPKENWGDEKGDVTTTKRV